MKTGRQEPDMDLVYAWNPAHFATERLGLTPDHIQAELLNGTVKRGLLNCSRQWGKSTISAT
jgi:hypothetical protein